MGWTEILNGIIEILDFWKKLMQEIQLQLE